MSGLKEFREMNRALYLASNHIYEAGLAMKGTFDPAAFRLFMMADRLASFIQPEEEKVSEERMNDILSEIMNIGENDGDK
jgi:hypothetical protein